MQRSIRITNDINELNRISGFLKKNAEELKLPPPLIKNLNLVMEEAVANIIFHAYEEEQEEPSINITLQRKEDQLTITLTDTGKAFDPTLQKDPDITLPAAERPIGGLGIYLIKQIMDKVSYKRKNNTNILIMKKKITS